MLSKVYVGLLIASIALMAFFTYYSWSWLQSIGLPATAIEGYEYHFFLAGTILWISSLILLLAGNAVLWVTKNGWALWVTFLYFAIFAVIRGFWLDRAFFHFAEDKDLFGASVSAAPFVAVIMIAIVAVVVFVDQFVVVRLHGQMYPTEIAEEPKPESEPHPTKE